MISYSKHTSNQYKSHKSIRVQLETVESLKTPVSKYCVGDGKNDLTIILFYNND